MSKGEQSGQEHRFARLAGQEFIDKPLAADTQHTYERLQGELGALISRHTTWQDRS